METRLLNNYKDTLKSGFFQTKYVSYIRAKREDGTWIISYIRAYKGYLGIPDSLFDDFVPTQRWVQYALEQPITDNSVLVYDETIDEERNIYLLSLLLESGRKELVRYYIEKALDQGVNFGYFIYYSPDEEDELEGNTDFSHRSAAQNRLLTMIVNLIDSRQTELLKVLLLDNEKLAYSLFVMYGVGENEKDIILRAYYDLLKKGDDMELIELLLPYMFLDYQDVAELGNALLSTNNIKILPLVVKYFDNEVNSLSDLVVFALFKDGFLDEQLINYLFTLIGIDKIKKSIATQVKETYNTIPLNKWPMVTHYLFVHKLIANDDVLYCIILQHDI